MRSFFEWFKGSTKVKRWMFLILFGVALTCYAFAKILVTKEIEVFELLKIIFIFVIRIFINSCRYSIYSKKNFGANY